MRVKPRDRAATFFIAQPVAGASSVTGALRLALPRVHDVAGAAGLLDADLVVGRMVDLALHVPAHGVDDARTFLEPVLDAPETASSEVGGLGLHGLALQWKFVVLAEKLQRNRVHAVAQAGRLRAVVEDM